MGNKYHDATIEEFTDVVAIVCQDWLSVVNLVDKWIDAFMKFEISVSMTFDFDERLARSILGSMHHAQRAQSESQVRKPLLGSCHSITTAPTFSTTSVAS